MRFNSEERAFLVSVARRLGKADANTLADMIDINADASKKDGFDAGYKAGLAAVTAEQRQKTSSEG
jgi:hypothetical protein